jgi:hypothetical protein
LNAERLIERERGMMKPCVREIEKGSETMTFRDTKDFPILDGRGRR